MPVPILKVDNIGKSMVIDEKMINDEIYTILSNRETGKIALLAQTVQINQLTKLNQYFGDEFKKVVIIRNFREGEYFGTKKLYGRPSHATN